MRIYMNGLSITMILIVLLLFYSMKTVNSTVSSYYLLDLPDKFYMRENACESIWRGKIDILQNEDDDIELAQFETLCPSLNNDFRLVTNDTANGYTDIKTIFQWGVSMYLYDTNDAIFALIEEGDDDVIVNQVRFKTRYRVYLVDQSGNNNLIAYSLTTTVFDTDISLVGVDEVTIGRATKSYESNLGAIVCIDPIWTVEMYVNNASYSTLFSYVVARNAVESVLNKGTNKCTVAYISGITVACVVGLAIIIFCACCFCSWCEKRKINIRSMDEPTSESPSESNSATSSSTRHTTIVKSSTNASVSYSTSASRSVSHSESTSVSYSESASTSVSHSESTSVSHSESTSVSTENLSRTDQFNVSVTASTSEPVSSELSRVSSSITL
jgi:hypothetical protein